MKNVLKSKDMSQKVIIVGTFILLVIFFSIMNPAYISYDNIMTVLLSTCVNGMLGNRCFLCYYHQRN